MYLYGCNKVENGNGITVSWMDLYERLGINNSIYMLFFFFFFLDFDIL